METEVAETVMLGGWSGNVGVGSDVTSSAAVFVVGRWVGVVVLDVVSVIDIVDVNVGYFINDPAVRAVGTCDEWFVDEVDDNVAIRVAQCFVIEVGSDV